MTRRRIDHQANVGVRIQLKELSIGGAFNHNGWRYVKVDDLHYESEITDQVDTESVPYPVSQFVNEKPLDEPADRWAHRSAMMKCGSCMWFVAKKPRTDFGRCRRHAPTLAGWPAVFSTDWCGDHKLDEGAIPTPETPS